MDLYPIGSDVCCPGTLLLDPTQVHVETKRITGTGGNRRLNIAASLTNTTGQDITRVRIMAAVAGAPQTRTEASVACGSSVIGLRAAAPVTVSIPVPEGVIDAEVDILGVEAEPASSQLALPVSDVSFSSFAFIEGTMAVRVTATVRNTTGSWVYALPCAMLRDADGRVVGSVAMPALGSASGIAPGASAQITGIDVALAPVSSVEISAPAEPGTPPVAIPDSPLPVD